MSHPAETLRDDVLPAPPLAVRRNHVGSVSLLCALGGTVACNLALAGTMRDQTWLRILAAGFEAAMVGGLADWFAVTALFRHPLGLPIPHTAIIPARRAKIIESIVNMVENDWLSPGVIGARLARVAPSTFVRDWIDNADHLERLGGPLRDVLRGVARLLTEDEVARFVDLALQRQLRELPLDASAGRWLTRAVESESAGATLESLATSLANLASRPRTAAELHFWLDRSARTLREGGKRLLPFVLRRKVVQRKIVEAACDYAATELRRAARDPAHPFRRSILDGLRRWADRLAASEPAALAQAERLRAALVESLEAGPLVRETLARLRRELEEQLDDSHSPLSALVDRTLRAGIRELLDDPERRAAFDRWVRATADDLLRRHHHQIGLTVRENLEALDTGTLVSMIEARVGSDLQFIRLNGAVVGGLVGVGLATVHWLLGVTTARGSLPAWFVLTLLAALGANGLANVTTRVTIELMRSPSPFAQQVRVFDLVLLPCFQVVAFIIPTVALVGYLWPIVAWFRRGAVPPPGLLVQRRVISAPLVVAAGSFAGWVVGPIFFPAATLLRFGRWTPDLASQHIVSPLVNGFLAVTTTYLLVDLIFRRQVVPRVFPEGRLTEVPGALALGVRGRLLVFLVAVAFVPLFTALGLVRAATARLDAGLPAASVVGGLARASEVTFAVYVAVGLVLTLLLARTFTGPLSEVTSALRRIRAGALDRDVRVSASDEVGEVEEGVNALLAALREKERILGTFGRIVDPAVRDRLLAGEVQAGGEVRRATVLFCDLRGFTALAERSSPVDLVATLNELFTVLTSWVRTCGGFVDKFLGDGLLVVFGLFDDGEDSGAASAVRCARGMHTRVADLNGVRAGTGRPPLAVSIGIHSGPVVAGTIGAAERHDYTVVGDTVNVAARLQEVCRDHEHALLVSGTTHDLAARGGACGDVLARYAIRLRGRDAAVDALALGCS